MGSWRRDKERRTGVPTWTVFIPYAPRTRGPCVRTTYRGPGVHRHLHICSWQRFCPIYLPMPRAAHLPCSICLPDEARRVSNTMYRVSYDVTFPFVSRCRAQSSGHAPPLFEDTSLGGRGGTRPCDGPDFGLPGAVARTRQAPKVERAGSFQRVIDSRATAPAQDACKTPQFPLHLFSGRF